MITKVPASSGKVRVVFSMPAGIKAESIHLVGDFNAWNTTATPLQSDGIAWNVALELDAGQSYQYRYLVDGNKWVNDWHADHYVPNEEGGADSVVITLPCQEREMIDSFIGRVRHERGIVDTFIDRWLEAERL